MDGFKSWRDIFEKGRHCWIVEWYIFLFFSEGGMEEKGILRRENREGGQGLEALLLSRWIAVRAEVFVFLLRKNGKTFV